ncbi:MAG: response regulator, partial [Actinobacteria bacterium]|nr:response regulator [Actinomycetota bacterium]
MENLKVVLVEDDDFTRGLLSTSLTSQGLVIAGAADNASAGLKLILDLQPDVALLDLNLGKGPNGLDLAVTVRQRAPQVGIVMLTSIEDPRLLGPNLSQAPAGVEFLIKREMGDIEKVVTALKNAKRAASTPAGHRTRPAGVPRVKEFTDSQ